MAKYQQFQGKAIAHDFGESSKQKTPYISLIFETIPKGDEPAQKFEWQGWLTEKCWNKTMEQLELCGATFPDGDLRKVTGYDRNIVPLSIEETEYGPRVAWINKPGSVTEENRLGSDKLANLAREMRGRLLQSGGNGRRASAPKVADPFAGMSAPQHHDDAQHDGRDSGGQYVEWDGTGVDPSGSTSNEPF